MIASQGNVSSQTEVSGWGNLRGIRFGGQLVPFTTAVGVYSQDFTHLILSQREGPTRTSQYTRDGNTLTVGESLQISQSLANGNGASINPAGFIHYTIHYTDTDPGSCDVAIQLTSPVAHTIGGIYYFVNLPFADFANGTVELIGGPDAVSIPLTSPNEKGRCLTASCTRIQFNGRNNAKIEMSFTQATNLVIQQAHGRTGNDIQVYFPIISGPVAAGQTDKSAFTLKASIDVDTAPATISLNPAQLGCPWLGIGGNFRIQNQHLDALHIQYIFDNMRVAYGRVALPWNLWQPDENAPPPMLAAANLAAAQLADTPGDCGGRGGGMNEVVPALEIAHRLAKQNTPMILSIWFPPAWATLQNVPQTQPNQPPSCGHLLDPAKWDVIAKSIGSYLIFLRDHYGAEPELFSFNESNLGIDVRQTPQDHADAIKSFGAHFQSLGLKSKMLLGDTSDALAINFIKPALNDPRAIPYIGAISFHSWRGATDEQYRKWADAAAQLGVPLIDAEGGNDAQAYGYSDILRESWYALDEAAEYVRIMQICQPKTILEWQLTENYSVLSTDKYGNLQPTQRFFNLKQFNLAPAGSAWMAIRSDNALVLAAGFAALDKRVYTIHLVNNGATRKINLTGLPASITELNVYVTSHEQGMARIDSVKLHDGSTQFELQAQTLTTLTNAPQ